MGPKYNEKDSSKDTDTTEKDAERTWHNARTDDQRSDNPTVDYGSRQDTYVDINGNIVDEDD